MWLSGKHGSHICPHESCQQLASEEEAVALKSEYLLVKDVPARKTRDLAAKTGKEKASFAPFSIFRKRRSITS